MRAKCVTCGRDGKLGHNIMYVKVLEDGKRISVPICNRCESQLQVKKR